MSTVFIGHSGQRLAFDPSSISTLESLRSFVAQHGIQARNQILLTAAGKQVRTQTLLTEHELFVFDSSLLSSKASTTSLPSPTPGDSDFAPGTPPDTISNQNDLPAWQNLFRLRRSWASGLLNGCETRAKLAERYQDEQAVIERSLGVAVASLQQHIRSAEQKYAAAETWADEVLQDLEQHAASWEANLDSLRSIPARTEFLRFVNPPTTATRRLSQQGNTTTLQSFVDVPAVRKAADGAKAMMNELTQKISQMRQDLDTAKTDGDGLLRAVEQISAQSTSSSSSEAGQLLEEIRMVVKKMASDLEHVQSLPRSPQSISQASKMALLHTRNYLPNLGDFCSEMNELVRRTRQQRESAAETALENMRSLASTESVLASLYQETKTLELPSDDNQSMATLSVVSRLPSVYGSLLVEAVRRREWIDKMKHDCETLQEEVATYQYEEDKRRKKWIQSVEDVCKLDALSSNVLGIELSLLNQGGSWPMVARSELQGYIQLLHEVYGQCDVTQEMEQAVKDLDKPTRKQIKHAKAFKNGSMHEGFGDTSLLLRGDEQYKHLRELNVRLEEEVKGQKSRVRKLEDLLHRQSHISRASAGDAFTPQSLAMDRNFTPPLLSTPQASEDASRTGSFRQRRLSSITKDPEEIRLAKRVVDLEAELHAVREEATSRKSSDAEVQKQFQEAVSTKKDLMENMEAQQREFATERRGLEKELAETKERAEELDNEIERLMGSRDDERTGVDNRVLRFEEEISRLKQDATAHAAQVAAEQEARNSLQRKLELAEAARATAEMRVRELQADQEQRRESESEHLQTIAAVHKHLSPETDVPDNMGGLISSLDDVARKSASLAKDLAEAIAFAKSENENLSSISERQKSELASAAEKQTETEAQLRQTQERVSTEEAKVKSLEQQLSEENEQLRTLRSKFAEGETGSEVLRQRVSEEEAKVGKLSSDLAEARSHVNGLDVELMRLQKMQRSAQETAEASSERLSRRAEHAKDVSQRLFAQNSRLTRLLERLGLAISYQDGEMVVERASKLNASTSMPESRDLLNRTVSLTSPPPTRKSSTTEDIADLSILRWPEALTVQDEATQFDAYLQQVSRFNIDTFGDAVVKRLRDFEYTAKKYNKEAKESSKRAEAYKERSMKLRGEAHAKIAVKDFKEGDLALFLPTRGQAKGAWAAFNINCPHYFLAEREGMRLGTRDFIVGRISKIEQKVVDLSKATPPAGTLTGPDGVMDNDNPFDLSDGLTWWLVHATEERGAGGAPSTPGLGKSTVAAANVDATGSIRIKRSSKGDDASKHLNKSLDSRRSSSTSKKGVAGALVPTLANASGSPTVGSFAEAVVSASASPRVHTRSNSLAESKFLPFAVGTPPGGSGPSTSQGPSAASPPQKGDPQQQQGPSSPLRESHSRPRSPSPSRSVRSLQRHLDPRLSGGQDANTQVAAAAGQPSSASSPHISSPLAKPTSSPHKSGTLPARVASPSKPGTPSPAKKQPQGWEQLWGTEFAVGSAAGGNVGGQSSKVRGGSPGKSKREN